MSFPLCVRGATIPGRSAVVARPVGGGASRCVARAVVLLFAAGACVHAPARTGLGEAGRAVAARTPFAVTWQALDPRDSLVETRVRRALSGEVPVDTAVQVALLRNRALQATFEELGIAQADVWQASLLSNPVATGDVLDARSAGRPLVIGGVVLPFVEALQRPLRTRVAASALAATEFRVADAVIHLVAQVRVAYAEAQAASQQVELWERVVAVTDARAQAAVALHDAGNVSDLELAREQEAAADARVTLARAVETRGVAHAELRRVMGVVDDVTWHTTPRLPDPDTAALSVAELTRIARSRRLDLRARRQDVETLARRLGFTRRFALLADGTIGLSYEREPDGVFAGGGLSLPIPLFDRGKARIARARAELRQAVALHDATVVDIEAEVRSRVARLEGARARALHLRRSVLPLRGRIVAETQRFVNAMQETVFTLLVARQSEIDAEQAYIDALREYWSARAELERVVGGSFAALSPDEVLALETAPSLLQPLSPIAR